MLAQMDWPMLPFTVFYLMLAALAVVVWVQLRRDDFDVRVMRQPSRRTDQRVIAARTSSQHATEHRERRD